MGTHAVQRDATSQIVSENVRRLRKDQNLGLRGLSAKLAEVGRPLGHSAVDQIEKGTRRVDVDDLVALAAALGVSPISLLMPNTGAVDPDEKVDAPGVDGGVDARRWWGWLRADSPLLPSSRAAQLGQFLDARPEWESPHMWFSQGDKP